MRFLEFFAGGGMARAGLGPRWHCVFANDFDHKKAESYRANWSDGALLSDLHVGDVRDVDGLALPSADLAWASFPCQDLSLAGGGAGLQGERSGTFYPFCSIIDSLRTVDRAPPVVAIENVVGTITSHGGADFEAICRSMVELDYRLGCLVIDASLFVPQSRPRLFVVAVRSGVEVPDALLSGEPVAPFHTRGLVRAVEKLPADLRSAWRWWRLPLPPPRQAGLSELVEEEPTGVEWHTAEKTAKLLGMMNELHRGKVEAAKRAGRRMVGGVYKRTRRENGVKVQRAEVRFDDVAGCLRTPAGGSSRQDLLVVDGDTVRSRLVSPRETARLMGLPDSYRLPKKRNAAYHLTGDGVVVPVVRHLGSYLLEPLVLVATKAKANE